MDTKQNVEQAQDIKLENAGPVTFATMTSSPMIVDGFEPVGKPAQQLVDYMAKTYNLDVEGLQISITNNGEGGRVDGSAIVRPGDFVVVSKTIANN